MSRDSVVTPQPALPHDSRPRAPWERHPLPERGLVRCTRHFNKPTGLDHGERVWLVVEGLSCPATVCVNGVPVGHASHGAGDPVRYDITPLLAARNKLEIELPNDL